MLSVFYQFLPYYKKYTINLPSILIFLSIVLSIFLQFLPCSHTCYHSHTNSYVATKRALSFPSLLPCSKSPTDYYPTINLSLVLTLLSIFHQFLSRYHSCTDYYPAINLSLILTLLSVFHQFLSRYHSYIIIHLLLILTLLSIMLSICHQFLPSYQSWYHSFTNFNHGINLPTILTLFDFVLYPVTLTSEYQYWILC